VGSGVLRFKHRARLGRNTHSLSWFQRFCCNIMCLLGIYVLFYVKVHESDAWDHLHKDLRFVFLHLKHSQHTNSGS
jgi:hypothetical protein